MQKQQANQRVGNRTQQNRNDDRPIILSFSSIENIVERLTLDNNVTKVLVDSNSKIRIEIGANGTPILSIVDTETNKPSLIPADLKKIAAFRSFVATEKKLSVSDEANDPIFKTYYKVVRHLAPESQGKAELLEPQKRALFKEMLTRISVLEHNAAAVHRFSVKETRTRLYLEYIIQDSLDVIDAHLADSALKKVEQKDLDKKILEAHIPKWLYEKLSKEKLDPHENSDIRRVLFPVDAAKGLCLTVEEILTPGFFENQHGICDYSNLQKYIVTNALDVVADLCHAEPVDIKATHDPATQKVLKTRVLMSAPYEDVNYYLEPASKGKIANFSRNPHTHDLSKYIRFLSESVVAIQMFQPTGTGWYYNLIEHIGVFKDVDFSRPKDSRNIFKIMLENMTAKDIEGLNSFRKVRATNVRIAFEAYWLGELAVQPANKRVAALARSLVTQETVETDDKGRQKKNIVSRYAYVDIAAEHGIDHRTQEGIPFHDMSWFKRELETQNELSDFARFRNRFIPDVKPKKKVRRNHTVLTPLGRDASKLIQRVNMTPRIASMAPAIKQWLEGFSSLHAQKIGAMFCANNLATTFDDVEDEETVSRVSDEDDDDEEEEILPL